MSTRGLFDCGRRRREAGVLDPVPPLRFPHDMVPLPNGHVLVGYLRSDGPSPVPGNDQVAGGHGGLAEFTRSGELVRWVSAAVDSLTKPVENAYTFDVPKDAPEGTCGVPVYTGRYCWVMTVGAAHALVSLDVENPAAARRVARLETGPDFAPHWLAVDPGSGRLIVGGENDGEDRMLMARLDPATGQLAWDETLRERYGLPGIDFRRTVWPHGETGPAFRHAAVFGK